MEYSEEQIIKILNVYKNLTDAMDNWKSAQVALNRMTRSAIPGMKESQEGYIQGIEKRITEEYAQFCEVTSVKIRAAVGYPLGQSNLSGIIERTKENIY